MFQEDKQPMISRVNERLRDAKSILQCCISYNEYGGYCVPLSSHHRPATQKILSGEVWEPETINYIIENCGSGDIIHAGTYFGDFIPALSRACASDAKLWAFEPNRENYRCAVMTTLINDLGNVKITNAGLGSKKGSTPMIVADNNGRALGGASHLTAEDANNNKEQQFETADIVTIDGSVPANRRISILQLDVEGYEQQALSGAIKMIGRCKPILILETLPPENWLSEHILKTGYQIVGNVHANTILTVK
jgi:FkbM family methyltransferase